MKFDLQNPTRIVFGIGTIGQLRELTAGYERILLVYGGGSIRGNGVYDQVIEALAGKRVVEYSGIEANPEYQTVLKGAELARRENCDFVLGVGGGSVIDASKFLAAIVPLSEGDAWDRLTAGETPVPVPNGAVLTLPATGSESNPVSVISRHERTLKVPFRNESARPVFAILDPSTMKSLSRRQLENGVVDAVSHVIEQYLTLPVNAPIQRGYSETLLEVLFEWGPKLIDEDSDEARENVMWAANQALNGLIGAGVPQDWSSHMIGHAITALYGVDHARTLSMVMPSLLAYRRDAKLPMLARFARRVWHIDADDDMEAAMLGIERTRDFFARMGCPVRLGDVAPIRIDAEAIVEHVERAGQLPLGEGKDIGGNEIRAVLAAAA